MTVVDAITLEVARNRFAAVADEMGIVLRHTSLSPNIKERADCSAAIFTADGEMLAQAEHIPVHLGSMPESVAACIRLFDPEPGAQYAVNDPFAGGTHLNDLTLVAPVFVDGDHLGWVANRAHHADVGGEAPGSMPAHAVTVDQEGHRVPPTLAVSADQWVEAFSEPFVNASRTPWERWGDLAAQIGANAVGTRRFEELVSIEGTESFAAVASALLGYGERRMMAALFALPDGVFEFEDYMEHGDRDVAIRVRVSIDGDGADRRLHRERPAGGGQFQRRRGGHPVLPLLRGPGGHRSHDPRQRGLLSAFDPDRTRGARWSTPGSRPRSRRETSRPPSGLPTSCSERWPRLPRIGCRPPPRAP